MGSGNYSSTNSGVVPQSQPSPISTTAHGETQQSQPIHRPDVRSQLLPQTQLRVGVLQIQTRETSYGGSWESLLQSMPRPSGGTTGPPSGSYGGSASTDDGSPGRGVWILQPTQGGGLRTTIRGSHRSNIQKRLDDIHG